MGVFFARRWLRASARRLEAVHLGVLAVAVVYIGLILKTPPSVTQLFPLVQTWEAGFRGDLFLADPLLFVFWIFIAASLVLWGRGWFCGWVCPYGALLELVYAVSKRVLPRRWRRLNFPPRVHNVLRRVRYVVLFALIAISVVSLEWAERLAEVEPFKTTWLVGVFHREWYLVLYWWMLLAASVFIFRFFCRYVCPLGAALSIGTALRLIGIRRKEFCTRCKLCARGCDSLAIDAQGRINKYECLYCMECEQKYYDDRVCPPLAIARRQRERLERQQAAAGAPPPPPVLPGPGDLREPAP
jgi:NosR/NirI family nitrous oxide reductase transcriptional regulator